ncbi:MAG: type II toxin-antitoxin system death-on-curing family toxin [Eubacteriales bacterium]
MKILTKEQIIMLHQSLIENTGGSLGLRDEALLDSAINTPFQSFGDADVYPSLLAKAARLGFGLVKNHAFIDGNKRIGTHAMLVFLELNDIIVEHTQKELVDIILGVASGSASFEDLTKWLMEHQ